MPVFRRLTLLFALILVLIVVSANLGLAREIFGPIYAFPYGDKIAHFLLMGTLAMLISLGFPNGRAGVLGLKLLKGSLILAAIVTIEELSQEFLRNRNFSLFDLGANYAGIFIMGEVGAFLRRLMAEPKRDQ
jgi:polysaccharide biosynthesis protein VpsQ